MSLVAVAVGLHYLQYYCRSIIRSSSDRCFVVVPRDFFLTCRARESLQKAIEIK